MTRSGPYYSAFGLRLASEIELPELAAFEGDEAKAALVSIRVGNAPDVLEGGQSLGGGAFARAGAFLLDVEAARFLVISGREILVQPKPAASARDIRAYLLGSAIGALCLQRGLFPLHANAIVGEAGAVAFAGPPGAGKSTLAAHFLDCGRRVLCDDVCVVTVNDDGAPLAWPGIARIKLWGDAFLALRRPLDGLERVFDGEEKYSLPLPETLERSPARLRQIYILQRERVDGAPAPTRLSGRAAVEAILANTYRWEYAAALGVAGMLFEQAVALSRVCQVLALRLPATPRLYRAQTADLDRLLDQA